MSMVASESKSREPIRIDLHGAFVRRTDLSGVSFASGNLAGADAAGALFRGSDFAGANLNGTVLTGADLTGAKNLTVEQLSRAIIDESTVLPNYIDRDELARASAAPRERP